MAKINYTKHISGYDVDDFFWGGSAMHLTLETRRNATFDDVSGVSLKIVGSGLQAKGNNFTDGTISAITLLDKNDRILAEISGMRLDASHFSKIVDGASDLTDYLYAGLQSGDDVITGSAADDFLFDTSRGNDIVRGFAGEDIIGSAYGNDTLYGGDDSDTFLFTTRFGRDTIMDFDPSGRDQDMIRLGKINFAKVEIDQVGSDVRIDLGAGDVLTLKNTDVDLIGRDDFLLY
ncbi:MAG: hypothetical protein RLZZ444_4185 [Pseudomonadota bacterium]